MRGLVKESVHTAVISLENRIQALNDQRTNPALNGQAIAKLDAEIEQAERALAQFRAALRHEEQLLESKNEPADE
jgi:hypothetical protein